MEKVRYEEMLPHEIVRRRAAFPAAFIPLGGLEWHGEHLAVGNDALKAWALCEMAARRSGGFAFPPLWYGELRFNALMEASHDPDGKIAGKMGFNPGKYTADHWAQTTEEQVAFYRKLVYHVLVQMNTLEMKAVCFLCGHYPIEGWAGPAAEEFNAKYPDTKAFAATEVGYGLSEEAAGGDHAAKWETSYLWYLRPDCVDMSVFRGREDEPLIGVAGEDPRTEASIEIGRRGAGLIADGMVAKARELIAQAS